MMAIISSVSVYLLIGVLLHVKKITLEKYSHLMYIEAYYDRLMENFEEDYNG